MGRKERLLMSKKTKECYTKKNEVTKITPEEFSRDIECLRKKYCPTCENDIDCYDVDCIVMRMYWLLKEHLKEECKKQLKGAFKGSCEGCTQEHECSIKKSSECELFKFRLV